MPPRLVDLGGRICILGPSNSGKSTLAVAIGATIGLPVVHLDTLFHFPHTDWLPRPEAEFIALHDRAVAGPRWVIEGNYSRWLPQRLARATGLIVLDVAMALSVARYVRRTLSGGARHGALEGGTERLKWEMVRHLVATTPSNRRRYAALAREQAIPTLRLGSARAIGGFYASEGLPDPGAA